MINKFVYVLALASLCCGPVDANEVATCDAGIELVEDLAADKEWYDIYKILLRPPMNEEACMRRVWDVVREDVEALEYRIEEGRPYFPGMSAVSGFGQMTGTLSYTIGREEMWAPVFKKLEDRARTGDGNAALAVSTLAYIVYGLSKEYLDINDEMVPLSISGAAPDAIKTCPSFELDELSIVDARAIIETSIKTAEEGGESYPADVLRGLYRCLGMSYWSGAGLEWDGFEDRNINDRLSLHLFLAVEDNKEAYEAVSKLYADGPTDLRDAEKAASFQVSALRAGRHSIMAVERLAEIGSVHSRRFAMDEYNRYGSDVVRPMQENLADLGYYSGRMDGMAGPMFIAAMASLEEDCRYDKTDRPEHCL